MKLSAAALVAASVIFGAVAILLGRDSGLGSVDPDDADVQIASDHRLAAEDLVDIKFDTTVRGYRMSQVDAFVQLCRDDIVRRDQVIADLQQQLASLSDN